MAQQTLISEDCPRDAAELQGLVDVAKLLLAFDAAKEHGLYSGSLKVNSSKCRELISDCKAVGIDPRLDPAGPAHLIDLVRQADQQADLSPERFGDGSIRMALRARRAAPGRVRLFTRDKPGVRYSVKDESGIELGSVIADSEGLVITTGKYRWSVNPGELFAAAVEAATR